MFLIKQLLGAGRKQIIITASKRSLRRLCFHRCLSVHGGGRGVCPIACWYAHTPADIPLGRPPCAVHACMLGAGQQAGGTHPTGMHSCSINKHCHQMYELSLSTILRNCAPVV